MKENKLLSKATFYVIILLLLISLAACNSRNEIDSGVTDGVSETGIIPVSTRTPMEFTAVENYITELYDIGDISYISAAVADGSIIYFFNTENHSLYSFNIDTSEEPEKIPYEFLPTETVSGISINNDDYIDFIVTDYIDAQDGRGKPDVSIRRISLSNTDSPAEIFRVDISGDVFDDEFVHPQDLIIDSAGQIYSINGSTVYVWDMQGSLVNKMTINGFMPRMSQNLENHDIYVTYEQAGQGKIARIEPAEGFIGQSYDLSGVSNCYGLVSASKNNLLTATNRGVGIYEINNFNLNEVFRWSSVDMAVSLLGTFLPLSEGRIGWLEFNNTEGKMGLRIVRPLREGESLPEKETLIVGAIVTPLDAEAIELAVTEFNINNPRYRVEVKAYATTFDDIDEGVFLLNMDIITGKAPDIVMLHSTMPLKPYAAKGVFTDLYPFIEGDSEIELSDFQENVVKAHEVDGQLIAMPAFYRIRTLAVPKSAGADINNWNLDAMFSYVNSHWPENKVFYNHSKSRVFSDILLANSDALVDWSGEGSGFRRDLVLKMLHFADQFTPDNLYTDDGNYIGRMQDGDIKVDFTLITRYIDYQSSAAYFNEPVVYLGRPTENGGEHLIDSDMRFAVNQNSRHKNGAWEFIRSTLTYDFQIGGGENLHFLTSHIYFPILKSASAEKLKRERGVFATWERGAWHYKDYVIHSDDHGNEAIIRLSIAEDDAEALHALIDRAEKLYVNDRQVTGIIMEEVGYFFNGDKSAEDVADIMENRINLYVNELK